MSQGAVGLVAVVRPVSVARRFVMTSRTRGCKSNLVKTVQVEVLRFGC
jgi:hypothetical protein